MIVVVDDDENVRTTYEHCLKARGLQVASARDGEAALKIMESAEDATVLLDLFMPGMEGIETLRRITREYTKSRVIVMSGYANAPELFLKAALAFGAQAVLQKPFALDELFAVIGLDHDKEAP